MCVCVCVCVRSGTERSPRCPFYAGAGLPTYSFTPVCPVPLPCTFTNCSQHKDAHTNAEPMLSRRLCVCVCFFLHHPTPSDYNVCATLSRCACYLGRFGGKGYAYSVIVLFFIAFVCVCVCVCVCCFLLAFAKFCSRRWVGGRASCCCLLVGWGGRGFVFLFFFSFAL